MRRIIDKQGKVLGLINLLDLAVIIVLVVIGFRVLDLYRPGSPDFQGCKVILGILVPNVPLFLADSIVVGQDVYQDNTGAYLGKIMDIQTSAAELLFQKEGSFFVVKSPRNLDLRLRLQNRAQRISGPAHAGIYLGKLAVRVGNSLHFHTMYTSLHGEVESLRVFGSGHH